MSEMTKKPRKKRRGMLLFGGSFILVGILLASGFSIALESTNTLEFCVSCHSQQIPYEELKETTHWSNASGVHTTCPDCHVPKEFWPKIYAKIRASKDVYHEIIGTIDTREKYEARRWHMANVVWKRLRATDSRECKTCHSFVHMDLSEQDRFARKKHNRAIEREQTCIDCHKGVAHELPEEPEALDEA